jgi:hypothetical protein
MKKKIIILALMLLLLLSLTACKAGDDKIQSGQQISTKNEEQVEYVEKEVLVNKKEIDHMIELTVIDNYKYNDYGKIMELDRKMIGKGDKKDAKVKFHYVYDQEQRRIKEIRYHNGKKEVFERYKYDDKGNEIYSYDKYNDGGEEKEIKREYNDENQLVKKIINKGDFHEIKKYKHDQDGNQIKEINIRSRGGEVVSRFRIITEYDQQNRKIAKKSYRDGELIKNQAWGYDQYGNKILEKDIGERALSGQEYCEWHEWKYDKEGNLLKKVEKNRDGVIIDGKIHKYDEQGKERWTTYLGEKGKKGNTYYNIYDEDNKLIKSIKKNSSEKKVGITKFIYDNQGNRTKIIRKKSGKMIGKDKYKYDNNGNMLKSTWLDIENGKEKIDQIREYKYDQYGNIVFELHKSGEGVILLRENREYYGKDKLKWNKTIARWEDGDLKIKYEEKYNKKGDMIKELVFRQDGSIRINRELEYTYKKIKIRKD